MSARRSSILAGARHGPRMAILFVMLGLLVGGAQSTWAQSQNQEVTIGVDQDTYFALSDGPSITLAALNTFTEGTASYTFENNICGRSQGNDKKACWRVDAEIEDGDAPIGITLEAKMEAPPVAENKGRDFNDPESLGRKTLSEEETVQLLDDIGNTEEQGLNITYWAKATPEATPDEHVITVKYTLSRR